MALQTMLETKGVELTDIEEQQIRHQIEALGRRLIHRPEPTVVLAFTRHRQQKMVEVDLRLQLSPLGSHLISHQSAETAPHAVRLAVEDVERQLERHLAGQRGEPTFGVPSRRAPRRRGGGKPPAETE